MNTLELLCITSAWNFPKELRNLMFHNYNSHLLRNLKVVETGGESLAFVTST